MSDAKDRRSDGREPDARLADWVDGCMSPRDRERFLAELRVNPQLKRDLEQYERTVGVLRAALRAPTAPSRSPMADRVFAAIAKERAAPAASRRTGFSWPHAWWSLATAAALLACTFWLSVWSGSSPTTATLVSRDADDALASGEAREAESDKQGGVAPDPQAVPKPGAPASPAKDLAGVPAEGRNDWQAKGADKPAELRESLAEAKAAELMAGVPATNPAPAATPSPDPGAVPVPSPAGGAGVPPVIGGGGGGGNLVIGPADRVPPVPGAPDPLLRRIESERREGPATKGPAGPTTGGPTTGGPATGGPAGPQTPGPAGPTAPPPATTAPGTKPSPSRDVQADARTGSDDFYLGATRRSVPSTEKVPAEGAKAEGRKSDATPVPESAREESPASVARLPFVEILAVLPKSPAVGSGDAESGKTASRGAQAPAGGRGTSSPPVEQDKSKAQGGLPAPLPLDGAALQASLEQFLASAVAPATPPAAMQVRTVRGELSASPWVAETTPGKDAGGATDEQKGAREAEGGRPSPGGEERLWLIEGEREDVAMLLARAAELGRARKWGMRSGEMPAPLGLAKKTELAAAEPSGKGGGAASTELVDTPRPGRDAMRVVLRIRLSAQ